MLYLDHAATTTIRPEALAALNDGYMRLDRNASGLHEDSRRAKNALEEARERAAELIGVDNPQGIVFTGSGTEADNLAVMGGALASSRDTVVVSSIEHKAVLNTARALKRFGFLVREIPVTPSGVLQLPLDDSAVDDRVGVVSIMVANNEIGTIQPVAEAAGLIHDLDPDALVHTDAVQAFNSQNVTLDATGADLLSLASHKIGGPKGVGLLALRSGVRIDPVIHGGGQEAGRRAGTYNVAGIVAMVAAMEAAAADRQGFIGRTGAERDTFESAVVAGFSGARVTGARVPRVPHISHVRFPGVLAETLLIRLDQAGIAASAGSACQSGAVEPSHVLTALGFTDKHSAECIRFSFGWDTPQGEGWRAARSVLEVLERI
jgi:cysteine desulfurase